MGRQDRLRHSPSGKSSARHLDTPSFSKSYVSPLWGPPLYSAHPSLSKVLPLRVTQHSCFQGSCDHTLAVHLSCSQFKTGLFYMYMIDTPCSHCVLIYQKWIIFRNTKKKKKCFLFLLIEGPPSVGSELREERKLDFFSYVPWPPS